MSDPKLPLGANDENGQEQTPHSFNLWVAYGLMFLALLAAIGLATLIVLPFHHRR
jgi:hypothetical protein